MVRGRVAAPARGRNVDRPWTGRGGAAQGDADGPWMGRGAAAGAERGSSADGPVAATPRGHAKESCIRIFSRTSTPMKMDAPRPATGVPTKTDASHILS